MGAAPIVGGSRVGTALTVTSSTGKKSVARRRGVMIIP